MLNKRLYDALTHAVRRGLPHGLGGRKVTIKNENRPNNISRTYNAVTDRQRVKILDEGETYWVCCPRCRDTRNRLCVNHAWGLTDDETGTRNWWMVHCFNENCQKEEGFVRDLEARLTFVGGKAGGTGQLDYSNLVRTREVSTPPGPCVRLDELPPTHHSHRLLRGRGHDPAKLGQHFGVSYCIASKMPFANGRVIIPVAMNDKLDGWQARYVDADGGGSVEALYHCGRCGYFAVPPPPGVKPPPRLPCPACGEEGSKVPKYFSEPGWHKSDALLNYDRAKAWPFVVLTEGPLDAFRVGSPSAPDEPGPAVCLFGKSLSPMQKKMVFENWFRGAVLVLMDGDAFESNQNILEDLKGNFRGGVAAVSLPNDRDPGDCDHDLLWRLIFETVRREKLDLGTWPGSSVAYKAVAAASTG
jgi:hypothetical protein